jgi:hypothetical protein
MRRLLVMILLCSLAACSRFAGPREVYQKNRAGDTADRRDEKGNPIYSLDEQARRARERNTIISDDGLPKVGLDKVDSIR